uniref:Uncharacterized protein At2g14130 n=1 Tax=Arabidopsis thaliana TaxID=3702 RepID=Q9SI46_ARATH|nr:hypothetical protein [Arabidopsis thaliana]
MDSESEILALPEQIYREGEESITLGTVQQYSDWNLVSKVEEALGEYLFQKIRSSFLGPLVELGPKMKAKKGIRFSGKIFHYLMQQRVKTKGSTLWFRVDSQPIRFSLREFYLTTGIQCEPVHRELRRKGKDPVKEPYFWASKGSYTLGDLEDRLFLKPKEGEPAVEDEEKLCLAAVVLTEGILLTPYGKEKIPLPRLQHASDFEMYTAQPWGKEAFSVLSNSILRMDEKTWAKEKYDLRGFGLALTIWVLSAVPAFGAAYGVKDKEFQSEYPLILKWKSTTTPEFFKIVNLVNDVSEVSFYDIEFQHILGLVNMGYRLKKTEWNTRCVDVCAALEEVGQNKINNKISDSEKLDRILTILEDLNKRVEMIERILDIRMEEKNNQRSEEDEERKQEDEGVERQPEAEEEGGLERKAENDNESFEDSIREPNTQYGSYPGDDENTQRDVGDEVAEESSKDKSHTPRSSTPNFNRIRRELAEEEMSLSFMQLQNKRVKPSVHAEDNLKTRKQVPRKRQKQVDSADVDVPTRKEAKSKKRKIIGNDGDNDDNDGDNDDFQPAPQRKSKRGTVPSIHTQAPFTAEKKKHPILHPFAKVDATRLEKLAEWKKSRKNKPLSIAGNIVDTKWFTTLETPGKAITTTHVDAALELMKTRKESNPELFKNKSVVFVGSSFLNVIDESYMEFLDNKEGFQFQSEEIKEVKKKYVAAYSIAMPYIVRNILKKEDMDVSPFSIKVLTTFPQAPRNEESGIYMLKFMECYSMYTSHSNFEGNIIQNVRNKLAADIFTELGSVTL